MIKVFPSAQLRVLFIHQFWLACLLAVVAFPAACAPPDQTKTVKWQEEVKLSTGEVIVMERETRFKPSGGDPVRSSGWAADEMTIRFRYPPNAKEVIEWRTVRYGDRGHFLQGKPIGLDLGPGKIGPNIRGYSPEYPLLLDVEQETKQLVLITRNAGTSEGCDEYFRYRHENGQWKDDMLPEVFEKRAPNLLLGSEAPNVLLGLKARKPLLSSEARKLLQGSDEINISPRTTLEYKRQMDYVRLGYDIRFRQIGPDRCLCGHIGNPVKSGCAQKYESIKGEPHG